MQSRIELDRLLCPTKGQEKELALAPRGDAGGAQSAASQITKSASRENHHSTGAVATTFLYYLSLSLQSKLGELQGAFTIVAAASATMAKARVCCCF